MSSTGRGAKRATSDRYYTRYPTALAICERLKADGVIDAPRVMMEPSAGAGAFVSAMADVWAPQRLIRCDLKASLILPGHEALARARLKGSRWHSSKLVSIERDFLTVKPRDVAGVQAIIGNCPYSHAEEHIRHALSLLAPGGVLAFLLPVNFLASIKRVGGLFEEHPPEYVYVLDKRPQFMDGYRIDKKGKRVKRGSDSNEYAVFVWRRASRTIEPVIRWLQWSPLLKRFEHAVARIEKKQ